MRIPIAETASVSEAWLTQLASPTVSRQSAAASKPKWMATASTR